MTFTNRIDGELRTPEAEVGNVEWDQRFGRRVLFKLAFLGRKGAHEYILLPDPAAGALHLSSTGTSRYKEVEATARYLGGARRDLTLSYVWAKGTADLNNYDQFYGNLRNPIVRANEHNLTPPTCVIVSFCAGPSAFPASGTSLLLWSCDRASRGRRSTNSRTSSDPAAAPGACRPSALSTSQSRGRGRCRKRSFRAGIKVYNIFGAAAERDMQTNITSPLYGTAFNPIERSVGFVFGMTR